MCGLGRLYTKQTLIECLLEKNNRPEVIEHIRSLKDVKELKLTMNPSYKSDDSNNSKHFPFICKLIGLEMSGKFRFVGIWNCGCVMSERALKEIAGGSTSGTGNSSVKGNCPLCQQPFSIEDIVIINPAEEELELLQLKIEMRLSKRKAQKKQKMLSKTTKLEKEQNKSETETLKEAESKTETNSDISIFSDSASTSKQTVSSSLKETIKIKTEDGKQSKLSQSTSKLVANPKRLGVNKDCLDDPDIKRLKTDYSVAKDPNASDVYKSLFTTHHSDKEQNRAHWVTYNPFYN